MLNNRYQILHQLGEGGSSITYQAQDLATAEEVAIKILRWGKIETWKQIELFLREAKVLQSLDHPRIPRYIDYFVADTDNNYYQSDVHDSLEKLIEQGIEIDKFYLVQELVKGKNLSDLVQEGWRPDESEVKRIATQVLNILIYLQELIPPITHRDIKPQNLIRTENGEIFLVDFGGVQDTVRQTTVASSVVGTYGYMSPEQLRGGKTYLATDLYGLGASLIYMLTGKHPSQLPRKRLKIDFHQQVDISAELRGWIDKLIEPHPQNRFPSAQVTLDVLQGKTKLTEFNSVLEKPSYSSVKLVRTPEQLEIIIPSALNRKRWNYSLGLVAIGGYSMVFLSLLIILILNYQDIYFTLLPYFFYGFLLILQIFSTARKRVVKRLYRVIKIILLARLFFPFFLRI